MNIKARLRTILSIRKIVIIIIITAAPVCNAQEKKLDQRYTVRMQNASIGNVLNSLSRKTGYNFTYDTDLVEPGRLTGIKMVDKPLKTILDTLFYDKLFAYSIIDNHIIIYQSLTASTPQIKEAGKDPVYVIEGRISNAENGDGLPYATIGVMSKGVGAISNYEGKFNLKLGKPYINDTLIISHLGFTSRRVPVNQAINSNFNISLTRKFVPIPEVIIRNREPRELILQVRKKIAENYGNTPTNMVAFYRESVSKKDKILLYSEAVLELYKSSYAPTLLNDQIKIYKSRKINNLESSDTLTFKLKSGLDACLTLDGVKNTFDFLQPASMDDYNYRMTDIVNIGNEAAFVIEFEQKEKISDIALPTGSIYINTSNYGIHAIEFELNRKYIDKFERNMIQRTARGFKVKARLLEYRVNYRLINDRFFLNHVRGDLKFYARKKNKLFGSTYNLFFEMAVNEIDTVNVQRFSREERAPVHSVFTETVNNYDRNFWGTDNFVKPEESIKEALSRVSSRLSSFSSANNSQ
ncbi:MAG: carboxypeptidase-like regulatory domain-containing protein [Bacteroidales bacterium]|nr:carboxypeptidase-like regulatory domain-containing protein [Bacteroidales bacterium]